MDTLVLQERRTWLQVSACPTSLAFRSSRRNLFRPTRTWTRGQPMTLVLHKVWPTRRCGWCGRSRYPQPNGFSIQHDLQQLPTSSDGHGDCHDGFMFIFFNGGTHLLDDILRFRQNVVQWYWNLHLHLEPSHCTGKYAMIVVEMGIILYQWLSAWNNKMKVYLDWAASRNFLHNHIPSKFHILLAHIPYGWIMKKNWPFTNLIIPETSHERGWVNQFPFPATSVHRHHDRSWGHSHFQANPNRYSGFWIWDSIFHPDIYHHLVGAWATPLKNIISSIGMIRNPIYMDMGK